MRPKERISIVLDNIDWEDFINYLEFDDAKEIAIKCKMNIHIIKSEWEKDPDLRLSQILINIGILYNKPGFWYYIEETDYFLERKILNPEEILFWGTYGKDGKQPFKQILIKDMDSEHLQACLNTQKNMNKLYRQTMRKVLRKRKLDSIRYMENMRYIYESEARDIERFCNNFKNK
jgi:hypothetical protein